MVVDVNLLLPEIRLRSAPGAGAAPRADRRRHHRHDVELPVLVSAGDVVERTVTRDLSLGGMRVAADCTLPLGTEVELLFELPGVFGFHNVVATVRWCEPGHAVGLRFETPRAQVIWALLSFFRELEEEAGR